MVYTSSDMALKSFDCMQNESEKFMRCCWSTQIFKIASEKVMKFDIEKYFFQVWVEKAPTIGIDRVKKHYRQKKKELGVLDSVFWSDGYFSE